MDSNNLISIIVPVFNRPKLVAECLDSILAQTYQNWECIVVDDGSTDNTWEVLVSYSKKDERIRIFKRDRFPKNANTCRNIGVQNSTGSYIMFLDSDDSISTNCVEDRLKFMQTNCNLDFAVFPTKIIDNNTVGLLLLKYINPNTSALEMFLQHDLVWHISSPIYKKEVIKKINGFDPLFNRFQDIDLHIRVLLINPVFKINYDFEPDCFYFKDSKIGENKNKQLKLPKAAYILFRKLLSYELLTKNLRSSTTQGYRTIFWHYIFNNYNNIYAKAFVKLGCNNNLFKLKDKLIIRLLLILKQHKMDKKKHTGYYKLFQIAKMDCTMKNNYIKIKN